MLWDIVDDFQWFLILLWKIGINMVNSNKFCWQAVQSGPDSMQSMYPHIFEQLLTYIEYGVRVPKYGQLDAKAFGSVKGPQVTFSFTCQKMK